MLHLKMSWFLWIVPLSQGQSSSHPVRSTQTFAERGRGNCPNYTLVCVLTRFLWQTRTVVSVMADRLPRHRAVSSNFSAVTFVYLSSLVTTKTHADTHDKAEEFNAVFTFTPNINTHPCFTDEARRPSSVPHCSASLA